MIKSVESGGASSANAENTPKHSQNAFMLDLAVSTLLVASMECGTVKPLCDP